ncbi:hypothetical protein QBC43DRAFT_27865 [Cladorrhinum sp. PSN259]|nr:hypothetical protein QBC43DRAFT_27865 [Cladorrhinum sp. PSN259]
MKRILSPSLTNIFSFYWLPVAAVVLAVMARGEHLPSSFRGINWKLSTTNPPKTFSFPTSNSPEFQPQQPGIFSSNLTSLPP